MKKNDYLVLSLCRNVKNKYDFNKAKTLECLPEISQRKLWSNYKNSIHWKDYNYMNYLFSEYNIIKLEINEN